MWTLAGLAALAGAGGVWLVRESRLRNFRSPARVWDTLVEFWQAGSLVAVRSCLTPESLALLEYVLDSARPEPALPPELLGYLTRRGAEHDEVYRKELVELLRLARTNVDKFWLRARPRQQGTAPAAEDDRRSELGILRHILSGIPAETGKPAPRLRGVLETSPAGAHEYARVVYDPMFAGFGLVDTFKRTGRVWRLDLAAPLLEAAHASRTQFNPGHVVKLGPEAD
ncbi:MAG: hypothetical protein HY303_12510 [Candidatus Wallbacteria bacterium]|nr:hypothetical protein [Candidatus Wallbacteria bacterium]